MILSMTTETAAGWAATAAEQDQLSVASVAKCKSSSCNVCSGHLSTKRAFADAEQHFINMLCPLVHAMKARVLQLLQVGQQQPSGTS